MATTDEGIVATTLKVMLDGFLHYWKLEFSCRGKTDSEIANTDRKIGKLISLSVKLFFHVIHQICMAGFFHSMNYFFLQGFWAHLIESELLGLDLWRPTTHGQLL
jgi:hypothetical protein